MRGDELTKQVEDGLKSLEEQMQQGLSREFLDALAFWARFRRFSFSNSWLIKMQSPDATLVAGFKQWEERGYHVKRGEKAIWIRAPRLKKKEDAAGDVEKVLTGYLAVCVFDISQTVEFEEKPPPEPFIPSTGADFEFLYTCWTRRLTTLHGVTIKEQSLGRGTYGMASTTTIWIRKDLDWSYKASVLPHELAHQVGKHHGSGKDVRQKELEAELSAFVLMRLIGADHGSASDYLTHYQIQPGELKGNLEVVAKIVSEVTAMLDLEGQPDVREEVAA